MNCHFTILACLCFHYLHAWAPLSYDDRTRKTIRKLCTSSQECPRKKCCRNVAGDVIGGLDLGRENRLGKTKGIGRCSSLKSGPGQVCLDSCGCVRGYICYRTITGACCPPKTCWERKKAEADKKFWENCRPPTCFFPPSVNPGNNGPGRL